MAGELNTELHDVAASCRDSGNWLNDALPGLVQVGDAIYGQRGESESFWQGDAGDACRGDLTDQGKDGDVLGQLIVKVRDALNTFADKIDTVQAQLERTRRMAEGEGLIVTPAAILPPGPGPGPAPDPLPVGPVAPQVRAEHEAAAGAHSAAVADYAKKQRAFDEATSAVDQARNDQADAHVTLDKAMEDPLASVKTLKLYGTFVVSNALAHVKGVQTTANDLFESATKTKEAAQTMQARAARMTYSPAMQDLAERAAARGMDKAAVTSSQYKQVQRMNGSLPEWFRQGVEKNPGNWVKSGSTVGKLGKSVLRGVPFVGTTFAIGSGAADVAMGKDPWNAAADTAAGIGGGIAGGMAVGAGLGTVFPGPGNVVGGVIGGIAGGILATGVVDMLQGDL